MKLITGKKYDLNKLNCVGWTEGDGSGNVGYHWENYFRDGRYLGQDGHGIEPLFELKGKRQ